MESCRKVTAKKILNDMLGSVKDTVGGGWKALILDELTTRIVSSLLKMSDILETNVSVVENLSKARQPLPLAAVYFLQPTAASVDRLLQDFATKPLYPSVHVFFSSKVPSALLSRIKGCPPLLDVIKTLKESNLEFLAVDSRTFVTDHPAAAWLLLGDQADAMQRECDKELDSIALRLSTALASLNEFPAIRYRKGKAPEAGDPPGAEARAALTAKLAAKLADKVDALQASGALPGRETCDVLILDRSYDAVVPLIHEWTYECMVYDLLRLEDGKTYKYTNEGAGGKQEAKEGVLDETDEVWTDLRHTFIAEVYSTLAERFKTFQARNKAAKLGGSGLRGGADMSAGNIRQLITALPQYREVLNKLSLHIQISSDLRTVTNEHVLTDVGELEQDLVLGEKTSKEMIAFITNNVQYMTVPDRVRLLACYAATHSEKLDAERLSSWQRAARLAPQDMVTITNLSLLGLPVMKGTERAERGGSFFSGGKKKTAGLELTRRRKLDDKGYALNRFEPLLKDILTDLANGRLAQDAFPFLRAPVAGGDAGGDPSGVQSARTGRGGLNWTRRAGGQDGAAGPRRILVFIIGGAVRSEMRVAHEVAKAVGRDVVLGSTSIETPRTFLDHLDRLNSTGQVYGA